MTETSPPPPPDLFRAELDADTLRQLFKDLCDSVEDVVAMARTAPGQPPERLSLDEALHRLESGSASIQLRYVYQGDEWWDTLRRGQKGTELVRVRHRS
jgi:hypothetical protein